jgi:hypothetical protein
MIVSRKGYKGTLAAMLFTAAVACSASGQDVAGRYEGAEGHSASMVISKNQGRVRIVLQGGSRTTGSESVAADCEAVAEGEMINGGIRARLIPFEGEVTSLDAADIERMDSKVYVSIDKSVATVEGSFAHCGLQNALNGKYRKQ